MSAGTPQLFDARARLALIVVTIVMAGSALGFRAAVRLFEVHMKKEPIELRRSLDAIPLSIGDWSGERFPKLHADMVGELGSDQYLNSYYTRDDGRTGALSVHIVYYTGFIDAVPHVPDRCMVAAGFNIIDRPTNLAIDVDRSAYQTEIDAAGRERVVALVRDPVTGATESVRFPRGDFELRTTVFSEDDDPDGRTVAGYFFIANDELTPSPNGVKRLAFDPSEEYAYYCKVQFAAKLPRNFELSEFTDQVADLLPGLTVEVMRCLPDWTTFESTSPSETEE